jgi:hypothetical protein
VPSAGTSSKPIWIVAATKWGATLVASNTSSPVLYGFGEDNICIQGLAVKVAAQGGIKFTQSGSDFSNLCYRISITECHVYGSDSYKDGAGNHLSRQDGIKFAQTNYAQIIKNEIHDIWVEEGIDLVACDDFKIIDNRVYNIRQDTALSTKNPSGVFAKGGSTRGNIRGNSVWSTGYAGICVGQSTEPEFMINKSYEAKDVSCTYNTISSTSTAILLQGAQYCTVSNNNVKTSWRYVSVAQKNAFGQVINCSNLRVNYNTFDKTGWLYLASGQSGAVIEKVGNNPAN